MGSLPCRTNLDWPKYVCAVSAVTDLAKRVMAPGKQIPVPGHRQAMRSAIIPVTSGETRELPAGKNTSLRIG
jgi:hypothetical protein